MTASITQRVASRLVPWGIDLVWPLQIASYNATLDDRPDLILPFPEDTLALLVANTRRMWNPFRTWCEERVLPAAPLDSYVEQAVKAATLEERETIVYWAHDTAPGKLVAMNRAGSASGQVMTDQSHLSVHPEFGPWLAFRALIVIPGVVGPSEISHRNSFEELIPQQGAPIISDLVDKATQDPADWEKWLAVRDCVGGYVGAKHRYSQIQIQYHYTHDINLLADNLQQQPLPSDSPTHHML